jgi:mono/diheme cytochrome c family protein
VLANGVSRALDLFAGKPAPTNNTRWDAPVSVGAGLPANTYRRTGAVLLLVGAILAGCGGESTTSNPVTGGNLSSTNYAGPSPSTADIQLFKLNVWDNLMAQNRCGACHGSGGQSPTFVRSDDINLAYNAANGIVDLVSPANSRMVTKVGGGHNCWLTSASACADVITSYITAWAGGMIGAGNVVQLEAPPLYDPSDSKSFPVDSTLFSATVHVLLVDNCSGCHVDSAANAQSPFFADPDPNVAYLAAQSKMDLDNPANSRFVVRLRDEFHNCWTSNCLSDANDMEAEIAAFAGQVPLTQIDPQLVTSKALTLPEGIVASGGSRIEDNLIALYQFKTGAGATAFDTSGVAPDMHLGLSGNVSWVGGWGINISSGKAQASTNSSRKLHDLITATGEYSIEAWVAPANVSQEGPARIISYSAGTTTRNFTLGQTQYNYNYLNRTTTTDANGDPALSTADADEDLQATLQHVVVTYDPVNGRQIYVNGMHTGDVDPVVGGSLVDWDNSFAFVLGNEVSGDRQWQGVLRLVAIHNRALTPEQILQNFSVGVGEKFFLLFSVADLVGVPDSYIMFEVSQYDTYSYLFKEPVFISLDPAVTPDNIPVTGMRLGINGKEALVGQAWKHLDTMISSAFYVAGSGQQLSGLGTIIALEKGPAADEFFLTFEVLGSNTNVVIEPAPLTPAPPADLPEAADIGVRNFDEIDATMAAVTGVSREQVDVDAVFNAVRQQLPTVENIEGFLAAQQMAISQMAIEYCNALVDNNGQILRTAYFPGFDFTSTAGSAFDDTLKRGRVITPLLDKIMGSGLTTQPDPLAVSTEIDSLILDLAACAVAPPAPTCDTLTRTAEIVKAACAALLGSGVMLLQ